MLAPPPHPRLQANRKKLLGAPTPSRSNFQITTKGTQSKPRGTTGSQRQPATGAAAVAAAAAAASGKDYKDKDEL